MSKEIAAACDGMIHNAARMMIEDGGASIEMVIDRLLTFAAAQAVSLEGSKRTAEVFRQLADRIDEGVFARIEAGVSGPAH